MNVAITGMVTLQEIDFEKIWEKRYEEREKLRLNDDGIKTWDIAAEDFSFSNNMSSFEYGRQVKEVLDRVLNSDSEVLEIGPGPGTLVIPFAGKVRKITAVEPSKGMIRELMKNAEAAGISNYEIINKLWEEIDESKITRRYDLVICSSVLWIFRDVWKQLRRMETVSKGYCCVVAGTETAGYIDLYRELMGENYPKFEDASLIYNILYNRGRLSNVMMITQTKSTPYPIERWIQNRERALSSFVEITPEVRRIIREHVSEKSDGGNYRVEEQAAVIWWKAKS